MEKAIENKIGSRTSLAITLPSCSINYALLTNGLTLGMPFYLAHEW